MGSGASQEQRVEWACEQHPIIGIRWSEHPGHPYATVMRPAGCYPCGERHSRKTCEWRNIFEHPVGIPLIGDQILGKGFAYDATAGQGRKGGVVPVETGKASWTTPWKGSTGKGFRDRGTSIGKQTTRA